MAALTHLQESDIRGIADSYDLTMVDYEPIGAGTANSNFLVRAQQASYVLTVFEDTTLALTVEHGRLLSLLKEYAFPSPRPLLAVNGEIAIAHNDKPVMMKEYLAGQACRRPDKTMLHQLGTAIAKLHQVPWPDYLSIRRPYGVQKFPIVQGRKIDTEYESWIAEQLPCLEQQKPQRLPRGLIHGDMFYDNVLFEGTKLKAVIDFEDATCEDMVFDLGMGIVGLCTKGLGVALEKARTLVKGYEHIRQLEEEERRALQLYVEYAAATVSCWRYWKYCVDSPSVENADKHWQMVRVAEGVHDIPQARFLEMVFS
ncbi:homoserine kinase [Candidatus Bipolaricaulota bacterium]